MQPSDKPILFISDLHLDAARPKITALFLDFLAHQAQRAQALYILGDLFEAWIGDDAVGAEHPVIAGMRRFADNTPLYVMHGNRDFLLDQRFCQLTNAALLSEPTVIELFGTPTLLLHGDSLCTDDLEYQRFRSMVRNPDWQAQFLGMSLPERVAYAQRARQESASRNQGLDDYLMDVNQDTVEATLREHRIAQLIHGHTHRPAVHRFELDGAPHTRVVLGDWYEQGSVLEVTAAGLELRDLALA